MEDAQKAQNAQITSILVVEAPLVVCAISIILGAIGFAIAYYINRNTHNENEEENEKCSKLPENVSSTANYKDTAGTEAGQVGTSKRGKNKKRREAQQEFTHSWMVGNLKGHTAPVLDMDYASNGKFLASCAEDCDLAPEELDPGGGASNDDGNPAGTNPRDRTSSLPTTRNKPGGADETLPTPAKRERTILSRRQRKNRTRTPRENTVVVVSSSSCSGGETSSSSPSSTPPGIRRNRTNASSSNSVNGNGNGVSLKNRKSRTSAGVRDRHGASKLYAKLNLSDAALSVLIRRYVLRDDQPLTMGYPVADPYCPGRVIIFKDAFTYRAPPNLDANAREFVPGRGKTYSEIAASWTAERADRSERSGDSGHCSGGSLESSDVEPESSDCSDKASDIADGGSSSSSLSSSSSSSSSSSLSSNEICGGLERTCARCYRGFNVSLETGEYLSTERCLYHWGKMRDGEWSCCGAGEMSGGCSTAKLHVWTGLAPGINGPLEGYVRTKPRKTPPPDGCYGIYALDCEMCFTRNGLELAKVTVVGIDGRLVYDTLVRPEAEVIDYNTRFSGITAKDLARSPKSLRDVQSDLMGFVNADTVLIGHGLENDLRALRILHSTCVDTVTAFPHYLGLPYRRSLKSLARALLRRDIQTGHHDSIEDARTAAELMLWRLRRDLS